MESENCFPNKKQKVENKAENPVINEKNISTLNQNVSNKKKNSIINEVPVLAEVSNDNNQEYCNNRIKYEYAITEDEFEHNDSNYFRCYADLSIHRVMIGDYSRTQTYRRAILTNYKLFHQKVVLDVGAGTGILSLFCVQAGAKKVYAIEASDIAKEAEKVVATNGYSDKIVVIQKKVEEVELPEKVDVIVSEWMGYMLMYESMLPSILYARDKWLRKDGYLFPEEVRIYIAPISDYQEYEYSVEFWRKVEDAYKVNMSALAKTAAEQMQASVHVMSVDPAAIQSHASCVTTLQLSTIGSSVTECTQGSFKCSCFGSTTIHGFVIWFTVHFPNNVVLSTSPYEKETHWEQSVIYIPPLPVEQDTVIEGQLWICKGEVYHRFLDIELEYQVNNGEKKRMKFKMKD